MTTPEIQALTRAVRQRAHELGFHKVGFAPAGAVDPEDRLRAWLDRGFAAGMDYMARTQAERADVRRVLPGARSVIALAVSYYRPEVQPKGELKVSRYAVSEDYHKVIRKRIRKLRKFILEQAPQAKVKPCVDTSPVLERAWAQRAGVAWIGKSTMAIAQDLGTYTFLATLITDQELEYGRPHTDRCGSCTRCLVACPTDAFAGPYQLDARKCITYWTVEHRAPLMKLGLADAPELHGWVAGCDVCQQVCPWNKFARPADPGAYEPRPGLTDPDVEMFTRQDLDGPLGELLRGTALQRTGSAAIRRNARHTMGLADEEAASK